MSEPLFGEFPASTKEQWLEKANAELKGKDINQLAAFDEPETIQIFPYLTAEDLSAIPLPNLPALFLKKEGNDWEYRELNTQKTAQYIVEAKGAHIAAELADALYCGNEYLVQMTDAGMTVDEACRNMEFRFNCSPLYFPEIAKLRAARILWAMVIEKYAPKDPSTNKMFIHAYTSFKTLTTTDIHANIIRATTQAMAAVIGGCDGLTVLPFDLKVKEPDEFSQRIARNISLILKHEANLHRVVDPSAGSFYIETLTHLLAKEAWERFVIN